MKLPDLVLITWDDAYTDDDWQDHDAFKPSEPHICHTVGYVLEKTRKSITVCQTISENQSGARWRIPRGMVMKIEVLRRGR